MGDSNKPPKSGLGKLNLDFVSPDTANASAHRQPNDNWVSEVLEQVLQMEMAARPGSAHEVALAVKKELEQLLMHEIMHGDPADGRPMSSMLLEKLDETLEAEKTVEGQKK